MVILKYAERSQGKLQDIQVPNTHLLARLRAHQQKQCPCKDLSLNQDLLTRLILFSFEILNRDGSNTGPHFPWSEQLTRVFPRYRSVW